LSHSKVRNPEFKHQSHQNNLKKKKQTKNHLVKLPFLLGIYCLLKLNFFTFFFVVFGHMVLLCCPAGLKFLSSSHTPFSTSCALRLQLYNTKPDFNNFFLTFYSIL
jgi:hypothetical protein